MLRCEDSKTICDTCAARQRPHQRAVTTTSTQYTANNARNAQMSTHTAHTDAQSSEARISRIMSTLVPAGASLFRRHHSRTKMPTATMSSGGHTSTTCCTRLNIKNSNMHANVKEATDFTHRTFRLQPAPSALSASSDGFI